MDFHEAARRYSDLQVQRRNGSLSDQQYRALIDQLRVQDEKGTWWQPDPGGTGWVFWDGTKWHSGTPPLRQDADSFYIPPATPVSRPGTVHVPQRSNDFNEFKSSLMTVEEFRKVSRETPLARRPQKWWDLLSILGGVVAAVLWLLYSGMREGIDLPTPLLMIAIPVALVWFRQDIDKILLPLQPYRKKISRIILIGLGIATPFLTAWILYNFFNISQYPLMHANMVVGTLAAYAVTRNPREVPGRHSPPRVAFDIGIILFAAFLISIAVTPVLADDCLTDPLNAQDCLRTDGYAELMAGLIATILASLVNGPIILQTLLAGGGSGGSGGLDMSFGNGRNNGGPDDNPFTEFSGGRGPGGCV